MSASSSTGVSPLANLCYKMVFRHEVFEAYCASAAASQPSQPRRRLARLGAESRISLPAKLLPWVKQLSYFLMHFPDLHGGIGPLRLLQHTLLARRRERPALRIEGDELRGEGEGERFREAPRQPAGGLPSRSAEPSQPRRRAARGLEEDRQPREVQ